MSKFLLFALTLSTSQLLETNSAITTTADYDLMQKQVNAVILENIANDVDGLTPQQLQIITPIANYCPFKGGQAVYQARALLNDQAVYDDAALCAQPLHLKKPDATVGIEFKVYPNPANGYTLVELEKPSEESGEIALTDALGRQVLTQQFDEGDITLLLMLDEVPAGMYYLKIQTATKSSTQLLTNLK
jgi:Secretion system C-terminal sorting domain